MFGLLFYALFNAMGLTKIGYIFVGIFGLIGFIIGAVKIPTIVGLPVTKRIGGEPVSEIIIRYIKFKKKRKIYTYYQHTKEEK